MDVETSRLVLRRPRLADVPALFRFLGDAHTEASVSFYSTCFRLIVLKVVSTQKAGIIYDGLGEPAWAATRLLSKNGQRVMRLFKLRAIPNNRGTV